MIKGLSNKILILAAFGVSVVTSGCDTLHEDLEPCRNEAYLRLVYDYNMKFADAFPSEVHSVAVWAFDAEGNPVWKHTESGEALAEEGYRISVPLQAGKYSFIAWCGLSEESPFILDTPDPGEMADLGVTLALNNDDGTKAGSGEDMKECSSILPGLYHNASHNIEIKEDSSMPTEQTIKLSLTKDTNYLKILLQNLDGTAMSRNDFTFRITGGNTRLEHDNNFGEGDEISYSPWNITSGEAALTGEDPGSAVIVSVSSVLAELHTSRLMKDMDSQLVVIRTKDNKEIIRIPLIDYLLLVKGNYHKMTDQQYLDRQDEYSLTFFLDKETNWKREVGIYINSWYVVPPQDEKLH